MVIRVALLNMTSNSPPTKCYGSTGLEVLVMEGGMLLLDRYITMCLLPGKRRQLSGFLGLFMSPEQQPNWSCTARLCDIGLSL